MNRQPDISVIIPVYNRAGVIGRAVDSALNQTAKPKEVIVVDDGSTDDIQKSIRIYGNKIKYIRQKNSGPSAARNRGISEAVGEYIAFLDSDDEWLPEKLEKQVKLAVTEGVSIVITDSKKYTENPGQGTTFSSSIFADALNKPSDFTLNGFEMLAEQNFIHLSTVLVKKECFGKVKAFDETLQVAEDTDLWLRMSLHYTLGVVPQVLALRDSRDDKLSGDKEKEFTGRIYIFKKLLRSNGLNRQQKYIITQRRKWVQGRLLFQYIRRSRFRQLLGFLFTTIPDYLFSKPFFRGFRGDFIEWQQKNVR